MVDFETPVCKLFLSANAAQEKEKKRREVLLPTGVFKVHSRYSIWITLYIIYRSQTFFQVKNCLC
jgi:hypothetical protein